MRSLMESLLDDDLVNKTDEIIKDNIKQFLKNTYIGHAHCEISKYPNKDDKYEVSTTKYIEVKNPNITSLTDRSFVWNKVRGDFNCSLCSSLNSLEGAPKEVDDFYCNNNQLISLKGVPKKVTGDFYCNQNTTKFTENDIRKVCSINGRIIC